MQTALTVDHLCKRFGTLQAVDHLCLKVPAGTCYGLLGPNGAGKTTTLELLEGLQTPDQGSISYPVLPGMDTQRAYEQIGIQLQSTALPDNLTVANTLALFRALYRRPMALDQLIELCQLQGFLHQRTNRLSGGQRQRTLLALALVNDPPLVFLDEPTTGLDPQARQHVWSLVRRIRAQGKTLILTTHYMEEAQALCNQVGIMDQGRLIAEGAPDDLVRTHCPGVQVRLDGQRVPPRVQEKWPGQARGDDWTILVDDPAPLLRDFLTAGLSLQQLTITTPDLNDVFLKLTGSTLRA